MAKWDVTTEKGREALERFLMRQMGWHYGLDPHSYSPAWFGEIDGKRWVMPKGWVFGPTGMITLKRWAVETYAWDVETLVSKDFARAVVLHADPAYPRQIATSNCEQYAVALALARALEEMEGSK
mgnify:CR=1 FL=1